MIGALTMAAWIEVAKDGLVPRGASTPEALHALEIQIAGIDEARRAKVTEALDAMAAKPATGEGLKAATEKMNALLPTLQPADWSGSGEHPARRALKAAGLRVLHGLTARAKKNGEKKLTDVIRALPGIESRPQQELLEEAR